MKKNKMAALGLATVFAMTLITGCSVKSDTPIIGKIAGLGNDQIFEVDNTICSKPEYMLILMNTENQYKSDLGGVVKWNTKIDKDTTLQEYIMEKVKEDITVKYTLAAMALNKGIVLSGEENEKISKAATEYYSKLTDEEKEYTGAAESDVETLYSNYYLADKIYEKLTENVADQISDEEARVIKIRYIRMSTSKNKEEKIRTTMENVIDLVNGGYQEFLREAKQYSEDDTVEKIIKKNEASSKYEQEAFNLNNEEMSDIIQDGNNYYLIYCVESYMKSETAENKKKIIQQKKEDYFKSQYHNYLGETETDFNTKAWEKMNLSEAENVKNADLMTIYRNHLEQQDS